MDCENYRSIAIIPHVSKMVSSLARTVAYIHQGFKEESSYCQTSHVQPAQDRHMEDQRARIKLKRNQAALTIRLSGRQTGMVQKHEST